MKPEDEFTLIFLIKLIMAINSTRPGSGSGVLYNPYLDRSRNSSVASGIDRSVVEKDEVSDDSEEIGKPQSKREKKKPAIQQRSPLIVPEGKHNRGGFFSNMKNLLEMRKSIHDTMGRGATPTRKGDISVRSVDVSKINDKSILNAEASITSGKVSLAQFMDNLATQKRINTSKITARKMTASNQEITPMGSVQVVQNIGAASLSPIKEKSFSGGFSLNLRIKKNEFSSIAGPEFSSKLSLKKMTLENYWQEDLLIQEGGHPPGQSMRRSWTGQSKEIKVSHQVTSLLI